MPIFVAIVTIKYLALRQCLASIRKASNISIFYILGVVEKKSLLCARAAAGISSASRTRRGVPRGLRSTPVVPGGMRHALLTRLSPTLSLLLAL